MFQLISSRLLAFVCIAHSLIAFGDISLPKLVSSNMVLQRDIPLKIWGKSDANENVTILFNNQFQTVQADNNGNWMIVLSPMQAGGPYQMTLKARNEIKLDNILIGDVWICSGQSNMEWNASMGINNADKEIAAANYPTMRFLNVENKTSLIPLNQIESEGWKVCTPETMKQFSAVGYFFGRELLKKYGVPIGLIASDWGGSPAEVWISASALKTLPEFEKSVKEQEEMVGDPANFEINYNLKVKEWEKSVNNLDKGVENGVPKWLLADLDIKDWMKITCPGMWETQGLPDFDGLVWLRKEVILPEGMANKPLTVSVGMIDDNDITYFNGEKIGEMKGYNKERIYVVPSHLVKAGNNILVVKVFDTGGGGGIHGTPKQMKVFAGADTISISGTWYLKATVDFKNIPPYPFTNAGSYWQNTGLYNAMIHPLINYGMKGAIWYQGESNVKAPELYKSLFPLLIQDWRSKWNLGDFPFLFVQLANLELVKVHLSHDAEWALLRDAQTATLTVTNTGMAVAIDIGDAKDIHPHNKQDVGKRLALQAFKVAYNENIIASGPMFKQMEVIKNKMLIEFENASSGLIVSKGSQLKGFEIAGQDLNFVSADAKIQGNKVELSSKKILVPMYARYNWANNPDGNLYNKELLPAIPFKTNK